MLIYRAGIVGCGRVGCGFDDHPWPQVRTHAGAYVRTTGVELVALADVDSARLARYGQKFGVGGRYEDYRAMLERERLDVLSVCTGSREHASIIAAAVDSGVRAVLCEKPFTTSVAEADEAIARCEAAGVVLLVNHSRRFDALQHRISRWLRDGGLGALQYAGAYYGAGVVNTGTHLFDVLRLYFGDVRWIRAMPSLRPSEDPLDPNLDVWAGFESGLQLAMQAGDVRAFVACDVGVTGSNGRVYVRTAGFDIHVSCERAVESDRLPGYRELRPAPCPLDLTRSDELMINAVENALACLNGTGTPLCSGHDGRAALALAHAACLSAAEGGRRITVSAPMESSHAC